jgi:FkbH-like protein
MTQAGLHWLPACAEFRPSLKALRTAGKDAAWLQAVALANYNLDFVQTNALDQVVQSVYPDGAPVSGAIKTIRLAVLGSSTVTHLHPGIRVAGLRRGIRIITYEADYGQYRQELMDVDSALFRFRPDAVLFALDAYHLSKGLRAALDSAEADALLEAATAEILSCWQLAKEAFKCTLLQQAVLPCLPDLLGGNEHRLAGSPAFFVDRLNTRLREMVDAAGVHLIAVDRRAVLDGINAWHDAALWHRSKQEITLPATPMYGDLVARVLAAITGRSSKCLVLDLDNTLWGGVIGDDGLQGIVLGQGSATGEAFADFQRYASELSERGIILAVCSKNDDAVAAQAFAEHPEMVLKREQIASFVANWDDKATNIRRIAEEINIGLDALVFVDDNPFERSLVRRELPMVAVPEIPEDPALVGRCLADAGYFESVGLTDDDRARTKQYQLNRARSELLSVATDMEGYLRSLEMVLQWRNFDQVGLQRTVQLINKTNQFNLTTRRYTEDEVLAVMADERSFGLQLRLLDRFGDNGIIAIIIGRPDGEDVVLDTWLMSCRVLGRQVEQATLNLAASEAKRLGAENLIGVYKPSAKNGMVREHYPRLGFTRLGSDEAEQDKYVLPLRDFSPVETFIRIERLT